MQKDLNPYAPPEHKVDKESGFSPLAYPVELFVTALLVVVYFLAIVFTYTQVFIIAEELGVNCLIAGTAMCVVSYYPTELWVDEGILRLVDLISRER